MGVKVDTWLNFSQGTERTEGMLLYVSFALVIYVLFVVKLSLSQISLMLPQCTYFVFTTINTYLPQMTHNLL